MRASVRAAFLPYTKPLEGVIRWMYLDVAGLVTTGIGNLIDSIPDAQAIPWRRADGSLASSLEVADAWRLVKSHQELAPFGGGSSAFSRLTSLRLDDAALDFVVGQRLATNESILSSRFPMWDAFPADAQLAFHSHAWANGPKFRFPKLVAAANANPPDWATAAHESHSDDTHNPGLVPRNKAEWVLFNNADAVQAQGLDAEPVRFPADLTGRPYPFVVPSPGFLPGTVPGLEPASLRVTGAAAGGLALVVVGLIGAAAYAAARA